MLTNRSQQQIFSSPVFLAGLVFFGATTARGTVVAVTSINDIDGSTITFDEPSFTANEILPAFDMIAVPDALITTLIPPVTGNDAAPVSHGALFSDGFLIKTTGLPWAEIGLTGVSSIFGQSRTLEVSAFDSNGFDLGSITEVFAPADSSARAYNAAAVFLGLRSTVPISAIQLSSDDPNVAWDNLRYDPVPEPVSMRLLACGMTVLILLTMQQRLRLDSRLLRCEQSGEHGERLRTESRS